MVENVVISDGEKIWKEIKIMFLFLKLFPGLKQNTGNLGSTTTFSRSTDENTQFSPLPETSFRIVQMVHS